MESRAHLSEKELVDELRLVRRSLQCPTCGAPTGDLTGLDTVQCQYCKDSFTVADTREETRDELSYTKLQAIARLQVETATMSSRMDIQFDPDRFVARADADEAFERFLAEHGPRKKLFLLLGEAGFGKTWQVAHWANKLLAEGYPVFYVRLMDGIDIFFRTTFDCTRTEALRDVRTAVTKVGASWPIVWVLDGYDEIHDADERSLLLIEFLKVLEKSDNQLAVVTSRAFDWERCRTRQAQEASIERLTWTPEHAARESFRLAVYAPCEIDSALQSYNLPSLTEWDPALQSLAMYPLWVRLIADWYAEHGALPGAAIRVLFDAYFKRMRLGRAHLAVLADFAWHLTQGGDLRQELQLEGQTQIPDDMLYALNSCGILTYNDDFYNPSVQLATPAFGWFGAAFRAFTLWQRKEDTLLSELLAAVDELPARDRAATLALVRELGVQSPTEDKGEGEGKSAVLGTQDYHGTPLIASECDAMLELEGLLGKPVPDKGLVNITDFGFEAEGGYVTSLDLSGKGLASLPDTLS